MRTQEQFPIRIVSEQTGVNPVTLRAWERRYGLIKPLRTPKGHRLYTQEHIELINVICDMLNDGLSISKISSQLLERDTRQTSSADQDVWKRYIGDMVSCITRFDERGLDAIYNDANSIYPVDVVTNRLIIPLLKVIGDRWDDRTGTVAEEHFFSVYLRNKIGARFHHQNVQNRGHKIIAACLPGEKHEFGLLLFALSAHSRGYRITLLGSDMPLEELASVASITRTAGIVLTGSEHLDCSALLPELKTLRSETDVPMFIGGDVVEQCGDLIDMRDVYDLGSDITSGISIISQTLSS